MSDHWVTAVVTASVGALLILAVRFTLSIAFGRYIRRLEARRGPEEGVSARTRLGVLQRVIIAFLCIILAWQVLAIFPSTQRLGNTLLASGAVLALIAGLAFTVPLGNLGAGILLAFSQPVRIGDRVSIGDVTGTTDQINLMHTVLLSDDQRRIYIPNSQMVSSVVVNRTVRDLGRMVTLRIPVSLSAPLDKAKAAVLEVTQAAEGVLGASVTVGEITQSVAWLTVVAQTSPSANVGALTGELRERAVLALGREQLLPS
jgi:small conductance mechanosensitive channel